MAKLRYRQNAGAPWQEIDVIKGDPGNDYVLTEEDKKEIAGMVGGTGEGGASTADKISFDDSYVGLGADNVQDAIAALADDQVGSEEVQDMIEYNLDERLHETSIVLPLTQEQTVVSRISVDSKEELIEGLKTRPWFTLFHLNGFYLTLTSSDLLGLINGLDYYTYDFSTKEYKNTNSSINNFYTSINKTYAMLCGKQKLLLFYNVSSYYDIINVLARYVVKPGFFWYDGTASGLSATTLQKAIDELAARPAGGGDVSKEEVAEIVKETIQQNPELQGPKGDPGESGVYVGTAQPEDPDVNVWINPEGEAGGGTDTGGSVDLSNYYNKQEVDGLIAAVELKPGPQGPAGKDGSNYTITAADYQAIANVVYGMMVNASEVAY